VSTQATLPRPRVLLVDDRPDNLLALEAVLEPLDVDLVSVSSGTEALGRLLDEEFSVLVLDVQMPVLDGFETARLIKSRERTRHLPIIFLTAISQTLEHHLLGYEHGAIDYVSKPFEPEILRAKVRVLAELWLRGQVIERQKTELAERLAELDRAHAALARQAVELERSNTSLQRFAEVASSELREPLCNVAGFLDLLATRHPAPPGDEAAVLVERSTAGVARMLDLVDQLLGYARVSGEQIQRERFPLGEAVADAESELASTADGSAAKVLVDGELPTVMADRHQMTLLLANLLDNAARFRSESAPLVRVSASTSPGGWRVAVTDNGRGIDPSDVPRLFTLFSRARPGGQGVGLAMCRRIVERHGGSIGADPAPGGGTEVWFEIPDPER
jgi:signal transduction histidine kinase